MANTLPIAISNPKIQWGGSALTTANTAVDGTGAMVTAFTAHASKPSICHYLILKPAVHNAATTATALRVFINDGTGTAAANSTFFKSFTLPATTEAAATGTTEIYIQMNVPLPAGYKVNCALGTTSSNGWQVTGVGGDC